MLDDPRIKRVLKRYLKGDPFFDSSLDVSKYGDAALMEAFRCQDVNHFSSPRELDDHALGHFSRRMGMEFDHNQFDYFLHSYVRSEFFETYSADSTVINKPSPEAGPPKNLLPKGMRWFSVRPKNGQEHFEAYEVDDQNNAV